MLVKMYCPIFWLMLYVASLIQSYSPNMFICPFLSCDGEDLRCVVSLTQGWTLFPCFSLLVQLCGPCHAGHYHLHLLPAEVLRVLYQPACASPSTFAVWVRHLWMGVRHIVPSFWGKAGDTQWTCVFVPHQVVDHTSHVPSLLRVQDPQHSLRGPHQREPLHWDQRQRGHFCAGAIHQQCESAERAALVGTSISASQRTAWNNDLMLLVCGVDPADHYILFQILSPPGLNSMSFSSFFLYFLVWSNPWVSFDRFFCTPFCLSVALPTIWSCAIFAFHLRCYLCVIPFIPEALTNPLSVSYIVISRIYAFSPHCSLEL